MLLVPSAFSLRAHWSALNRTGAAVSAQTATSRERMPGTTLIRLHDSKILLERNYAVVGDSSIFPLMDRPSLTGYQAHGTINTSSYTRRYRCTSMQYLKHSDENRTLSQSSEVRPKSWTVGTTKDMRLDCSLLRFLQTNRSNDTRHG
jgi:hypothetical protein